MTVRRSRRLARPLAAAALAAVLATSALAADPAVRENTDFTGDDIEWFDLPRPWIELCRQACVNNNACRAWTYLKPDERGPLASCWLKSGPGQATSNPCCTSGTR
jgi:hypothetical protein